MVTRTISKELGGVEDLLFGDGLVSQSRGGSNYTINRILKLHPLNTKAELIALDTLQVNKYYGQVELLGFTNKGDGGGGVYWYDVTEPIASDNGSTILAPTGVTVGCWKKITPTADTQTNFTAIANSVNTINKYEGKQMWDSTNKKPVWASGSAASAVWVSSTGTTSHTPV